jgi:hypothetical protein
MTQQIISVGSLPGDGTGDKGQVPFNKVNSNFNELYNAAVFFGIDTGTLNNIVIPVLDPSPESFVTDPGRTQVYFTPAVQNTGPATLNAASTGAIPIVTALGAPLSGGEFDPGVYSGVIFNGTEWQLLGNQSLTSLAIGPLIFPVTNAETSSGVVVVNPWYPVGNVLRYGILPNNTGVAAANGSILQTLLNYNTVGITGLVYFPNTTGSDVYSFTGVCTVRLFVHLDLGGCTISVTGSSTVNDAGTGFFYVLSDVIIENGTISTAVNTALGTGAGAAIQVGARGTGNFYFPIFGGSIFDSLLPSGHSQGRVTIRNIIVQYNNTGTLATLNHGISMLGGLSNVVLENIVVNCNNISQVFGVYCEWGWATSPSGTATTQTSHGHNLNFVNLRVINSGGSALGLTGTYNCIVDGLYAVGCVNTFLYSVGEAMFFNPWVGVDDAGAKRNMTLRNIVGENITGTSVQLLGSNNASGTYLSGAGLTPAQQTDLMSFTLDGFALTGTSTSLFISGPASVRNGYCLGGSGSGSGVVIITNDCIEFEFENVKILNGSASGVRADIAGTGVWSPDRNKIGEFRGCQVAGNATGFSFNNTEAVTISRCRIGYNALYDGQGNEVNQAIGVSVDIGGQGIICDSNFVTNAVGGTSYSITGTTSSGCNIVNPLNDSSQSGNWDNQGVASATNTQLNSPTSIVNTLNKYPGRQCLDNSTNKLFIAQGATATSSWISVDGVTTITP